MQKGNLAELKLILLLSEKGYNVSVPQDPWSSYDLILDNKESLKRIQIKSSNTLDERNQYKVSLCWGAGNNKKSYTKNSFDLFAIFLNDDWYFIPLSEVFGHKWARININSKKNKYYKYKNNFDILNK